MSYPTFKSKYLGKRVNPDGVAGYQCVDVIKQYLIEEKGAKPGSWGDALDYASKPAKDFLALVDKVGLPARQGDIVVFYTNGHNGDLNYGSGHIGIADGPSGSTVPTLEQNGSTGSGAGTGADAIRVRNIDAKRVAAVYRLKGSSNLDMPAVGSRIQLIPRDTRTTYKAGTANVAGKINVTDNTFNYIVRGYDSKYPGRIIINSASAGGNGVGLALYYLTGERIPGWNKV